MRSGREPQRLAAAITPLLAHTEAGFWPSLSQMAAESRLEVAMIALVAGFLGCQVRGDLGPAQSLEDRG